MGPGRRNQGWSLKAIFGMKAQHLSRKVDYSFPGQDICYLGLCSVKFKRAVGQRNTLVFALSVRQVWKPFQLPNNVPIGVTVPKSIEWHFHLAYWGMFWVYWHSGIWGNEIANKLTRDGSVQKYVGPETALGVSRENIRRKIIRWTDKQHMAKWWGLISTQSQAQKLISGPSPTAKTRLLSLNSTQSRVATGMFTGHNTLRRHLYLMVLTNSLLCRCGAQEETSAHVLCECKALDALRHAYLGSFFLDPENVKILSLGTIWNFSKGTELPWLAIR